MLPLKLSPSFPHTSLHFLSAILFVCTPFSHSVYPVVNNVSSHSEVNVSLPTSLVCLTTGFPLTYINWQKEGEEVMLTLDGWISAFHRLKAVGL